MNLMELTGASGGRASPPLSPPPIFPTHSALLALHLLGPNGSWECCDVMQWCMERTALPLFFFLPSSFSCGLAFSIICNSFPVCPYSIFFTICYHLSNVLAYLGVASPASWSLKVCTEKSKASLVVLFQGHAQSVRVGTEVYSMPGSVIHGQGLGTCLVLDFVLKDLFWQLPFKRELPLWLESGERFLHSCWIMAECLADPLQFLMPASLMMLRPLPQLLPTRSSGIQLCFPSTGRAQQPLHWKECGGRVEGLVTAGDLLAPC